MNDEATGYYFGTPRDAPMWDERTECAVPTDRACGWCEEPFAEGDDGVVNTNGWAYHNDCSVRMAVGGVNHILGGCSCTGGSLPPDPDGLSTREAATAAVAAFERVYMSRA